MASRINTLHLGSVPHFVILDHEMHEKARKFRLLDRIAGFYRMNIRLRATRLRRDEEVAGKG